MKAGPQSFKGLTLTWAILVALHFAILGISMLDLHGWETPLILVLAMAQMLLVMLIFMEVWHSSNLVKVFAAAGFFWLLIQFTLTSADYLTRAFH